MRKHCINIIENTAQKVNQNLLYLTRKLAPLQQSAVYGLLCSSTQWSKRMAIIEVVFGGVFEIFSGKNDC